jgi:hypothetical protein
MIRKHRGTAAAILGAAIIVSASVVASAEAAKPAPTPQPYTLGQEIVTKTDTVERTDVSEVTLTANCPSGKVPTGGGHSKLTDTDSPGVIRVNRPTETGWTVTWGDYQGSLSATGTVYVVCVNAAAPTS